MIHSYTLVTCHEIKFEAQTTPIFLNYYTNTTMLKTRATTFYKKGHVD